VKAKKEEKRGTQRATTGENTGMKREGETRRLKVS